jgi:hypothetical protein
MWDSRVTDPNQPDPEVMRQYMANLEAKYPGKFKLSAGYNFYGDEQPEEPGMLEVGARPWIHGYRGFASNTWNQIANAMKWSGKIIPDFMMPDVPYGYPGNAADRAAESIQNIGQSVAPTDEIRGVVPKVISGGVQGLGEIAKILMTGGGNALPMAMLLGGLNEGPDRPLEAATGAAAGGLTVGALQGLQELPMLARLILGGGTFGGLTAAQGGSLEDVAAETVLGAGLSFPGKGGKLREALSGKYKNPYAGPEFRPAPEIVSDEYNRLSRGSDPYKAERPVKETQPLQLPAPESRYTAGEYPGKMVQFAIPTKTSKRGRPIFTMRPIPEGATPAQAMAHYREALKIAKDGGGRLYFGPGFEQTELFAELQGKGLVSAKATKDGGFYALDPEAKVRQTLINRAKAKQETVSRETLRKAVQDAERTVELGRTERPEDIGLVQKEAQGTEEVAPTPGTVVPEKGTGQTADEARKSFQSAWAKQYGGRPETENRAKPKPPIVEQPTLSKDEARKVAKMSDEELAQYNASKTGLSPKSKSPLDLAGVGGKATNLAVAEKTYKKWQGYAENLAAEIYKASQSKKQHTFDLSKYEAPIGNTSNIHEARGWFDVITQDKLPELAEQISRLEESSPVEPPKPPSEQPKILKTIDKMEAAAKKRLEDRAKKMGTTLSANPLPELTGALGDMAVIGAAKIARGTVEFARWSAEMVSEFGEKIRPELERLYAHAKLISQAATKEDVRLGLTKKTRLAARVGQVAAAGWDRAKLVKQAKNRFKTEPGREVPDVINQADVVYHTKYLGPMDEQARTAGMKFMGKKEAERIGAELQKKTTTDPKSLKFRALFDQIHSKMTAVGLDVGYLKGYLPRVFKEGIREKLYQDAQAVLKDLPTQGKSDKYVAAALVHKSKALQEAVKSMMDGGMSFRTALQVIARATEKEVFIKSSAEFERTLKLPSHFYETDIRKIIPRYIRATARRMAEADVFGPKGEKWTELQKRINEVDVDEAKLAQRMLDTWSGKYELEHGYRGGAKALEEAYYATESTTKIGAGTAVIPNVTQPLISTVADVGVFRSIKAGVDFLNPKSRSGVRQTGTTEHTALSLFGAPDHGIASRLTKPVMAPFQAINRFNQYFSALGAKQAIPDWYKSAQKDTNYGRLCRERLNDMGVDYRKPLSEAAIKEGMYHYSTDAQLQKNIMNEPLSANNPRLRWLWLFKKFGYKQMARTSERLKMELRHGNGLYLLRLIAGGVIGGEAVVWAKNKLHQVVAGKPVYREEDWDDWKRYVNDLAAAGTVGVVTDVFDFKKIYSLPQDLWFAVKPVVADDMEKSGQSLIKFLRECDKYGIGIATQRNWTAPAERMGSLPRWGAERLDVPAVKEMSQKILRGKKRMEVLDLIIDGDEKRAAHILKLWNEHYPDMPIDPNEVGEREIMKRKKEKAKEIEGAIVPVEKGKKSATESKPADSEKTRRLREAVQRMSEARP